MKNLFKIKVYDESSQQVIINGKGDKKKIKELFEEFEAKFD